MDTARSVAGILGAIVFIVAALIVAGGSLQFAYEAGAILTAGGHGPLLDGGVMLAALDAVKIACLAALPFLIYARKGLLVVFAVCCICVGTVFSLYAAYRAQIVVYADADAVQRKAEARAATLKGEIADLDARLALPDYAGATSEQQVRDQMAGFEVSPKFKESAGCTAQPSPPGAIRFCADYNAFLPKLTAAKEADRMRAERTAKRRELAEAEGTQVANAEVKAIAEAFEVSMPVAYLIRSAGFALGYEVMSGLSFSVAIGCLWMALGTGGGRHEEGHGVASLEGPSSSSLETVAKGASVEASEGPTALPPDDPPKGPRKGPNKGPSQGAEARSLTSANTGVRDRPKLTVVPSPSQSPKAAASGGTAHVSAYISECIPWQRGRDHPSSSLRPHYEGWCRERGIVPASIKTWAAVMQAAGFELKKTGGVKVYRDRRRAVAEST